MRLVELCDVRASTSVVASPGHVCYSTPLAGYLRYRLFFDTPVSRRSLACFQAVVSVSVCVELIVSSLYCLHSVYAILILSIPICKNVLSFVSSL